jgi:hypothetical protein
VPMAVTTRPADMRLLHCISGGAVTLARLASAACWWSGCWWPSDARRRQGQVAKRSCPTVWRHHAMHGEMPVSSARHHAYGQTGGPAVVLDLFAAVVSAGDPARAESRAGRTPATSTNCTIGTPQVAGVRARRRAASARSMATAAAAAINAAISAMTVTCQPAMPSTDSADRARGHRHDPGSARARDHRG